MTIELHGYDAADYLITPEHMAAYLDATIEESDGDIGLIANALGTIARAQGMTDVAHKAGLGRQSLYKALSSEGKPTLETVYKVAEVLGLRLTFKAA